MQVPETSLAAYRSMDGKILAEHYQRCLNSLNSLGIAIYEQIADHAGFTDKNSVSRRMKELEIMELVYKPGTKGLTKSGRQAYQYKLRSKDTVVPVMENTISRETSAADYANMIIAGTKQGKLQQKIYSMTKEEVLNEFGYYKWSIKNESLKEKCILPAMDLYAEQQVLAFSEWKDNCFNNTTLGYTYKKYLGDKYPSVYDIKELYQIFNSINQ